MRRTERNVLHVGKKCDKCKGRNHFKSKCKKVHTVSQSQDGNEDTDGQWFMAVSHKEDSISAILTVNDYDIRFQLDSAETCKETPSISNNNTSEYVEQN